MKLARIGINGNEKPVLIDSEDNYRDLSSIIKDLPDLIKVISMNQLCLIM